MSLAISHAAEAPNPLPRPFRTAAASKACRDRALAAYAHLAPLVLKMHGEGRSIGQIAKALNAIGERTQEGGRFGKTTVWRMIGRHRSQRSAS